MSELTAIEIKLDHMSDMQERCDEKISDVRKKLYDPDDGLFHRVHDLHNWSETHQKEDDEFRENVNKIIALMEPVIADYAEKEKRKPFINKILVSVITTVILGALGFGWVMIQNEVVRQDDRSHQEEGK